VVEERFCLEFVNLYMVPTKKHGKLGVFVWQVQVQGNN
jgi:hypothetical protein